MKELKFVLLLVASWAVGTQIHHWILAGLFSDITYNFIINRNLRSPAEIALIVTGLTMYAQTILWSGLTAAFLLMGKPIAAGLMYGFMDSHTYIPVDWFFPDGQGTGIVQMAWPVIGRILMVVVLLAPLVLYIRHRRLTKHGAVSKSAQNK